MRDVIINTARRKFLALAARDAAALLGHRRLGAFGAALAGLDKTPAASISVNQFPGVDFTGLTDTTAACQLAIDAAIAAGFQIVFPAGGKYSVTSLRIANSVYSNSIRIDGAIFYGIARAPVRALFDIVNCVDFHLLGSAHVVINDNRNYEMGVCVRAEAGASQASSRVTVHNINVRNAKIGFGVGTHNLDYQCSEITFFGCGTFKCPMAVYNGGSQAGASYVGCQLIAEINPAFAGVPERMIWMEGGFVSVIGGELCMAERGGMTGVLLNPASSARYRNPYPLLRLVGVHIECGGQLAAIVNSRSLAAPKSDTANLTLSACGGYCSGAGAKQDFIHVGDATYVGTVSVSQCNFYCDEARAAANIFSAAPGARISVDRESFGKNFKHWMGGVLGGVLLHDMTPIVSATGIGATLAAGEQRCKFAAVDAMGAFARYRGGYVDGNFTCAYGIGSLSIDATLVGASRVAGQVYIKKNGAIVAFGRYLDGIAQIKATLHELVSGDVVGVYLKGDAANLFNGELYQSLQISAETR